MKMIRGQKGQGGSAYNIVSTADGGTIQARVSIADDGIYITFWQVER